MPRRKKEEEIDVNVFIEAKKLISKEENWCQDHFAKDENGNPVKFKSKKAVCFCARGALYKTLDIATNRNGSPKVDDTPYERYLADSINKEKYCMSPSYIKHIGTFNNRVSYDDVIEMFDNAIKRLSK